jgi:hypothetical protein
LVLWSPSLSRKLAVVTIGILKSYEPFPLNHLESISMVFNQDLAVLQQIIKAFNVFLIHRGIPF